MASTFSILVIALIVYVQGTLAHSRPQLGFMKNLNTTPKFGEKVKGLGQLKKHLAKLGYIDPTNNPAATINSDHDDDTFDVTLHQAIIKYQRFYKIEATGTLDSQTVESMLQPRCGVPDIRPTYNPNSSFSDMKYAFLGPTWPSGKRNLTVSFPDGTRRDAYYSLNGAFFQWAQFSPFMFTWVDDVDASDVKMSFQGADDFDGPGGVLAHSDGPADPYIDFDADENWGTQLDTEMGKFDLQSVALHELGHVLGLNHSDDQNSVMFPTIGAGESKRLLNKDDIQGIRALYPDN